MFLVVLSLGILILGAPCVHGDVLMQSQSYNFNATATSNDGETIPVNGSILTIQLVYIFPKGKEEYGDVKFGLSAEVPEGDDRAFYELDLNTVPVLPSEIEKGSAKTPVQGVPPQLFRPSSQSDFFPPHRMNQLFKSSTAPDSAKMLKAMNQKENVFMKPLPNADENIFSNRNSRRTKRSAHDMNMDKTSFNLSNKTKEGPEGNRNSTHGMCSMCKMSSSNSPNKTNEGHEGNHNSTNIMCPMCSMSSNSPNGTKMGPEHAHHSADGMCPMCKMLPSNSSDKNGSANGMMCPMCKMSSSNSPNKTKRGLRNDQSSHDGTCPMCGMSMDEMAHENGGTSITVNSWLSIFVSFVLVFLSSTK